MTTKKAKSLPLPSEIFVYWEDDDPPYLMLWDSLEDAAEGAGKGILIGTYILDHEGKYEVKRAVTEV